MESMQALSVLLVEDNPGDARLIKECLDRGSPTQFHLERVVSVRDALDSLSSRCPDAVLLDLGLPDSHGLNTLDRIVTCGVECPIIVLTGVKDDELALEAIHRGAQDFLPKGHFDGVLLSRTIRHAVERELAEKTVRVSEQRYRRLFEQANEAVVVICDDRIVAANSRTETLLGWSHADLLGMPFYDPVHPDDLHSTVQWVDTLSANLDTSAGCELRVVTSAGEIRWVELSASDFEWQGEPATLCLLYDISERKASAEEANRLLERQTAMIELTFSLGTPLNETEIYSTLCDQASALVACDSLLLCRFERTERVIRAAHLVVDGEPKGVSRIPPVPIAEDGRGIQSSVIRDGNPRLIEDYQACCHDYPAVHVIRNDGSVVDAAKAMADHTVSMRSAILVPLRSEGEIIGVFQVQSRQTKAFTHDDMDLLHGLANVAAIALRNVQLVKQSTTQAQTLQRAFDGIVRTVSAAVETRDPYTAGHQQRVASLAVAIAKQLGLGEHVVEGVRVAGLVHDIGKLGIPAEILAKPGALSDVEFEIIKAHSEVAYHILESIEFPWPVAEAVYQHHERIDGSGYPRGLVGDAVSMEARIIGVADVVEAMASHRPYRPAVGLDKALEVIESCQGTLFDARVVDACVQLFRERDYQLAVAFGL